MAVLCGGEHGAQKQHHAVRVLVVFAHGLARQVQRVAADLAQRTAALHHKTLWALHFQAQLALAHVVDAEVFIKQPDEGPNGAAGVVVLGFAEQQGAAAFEVTQVHVVAQGGPHHLAARVGGQHDFGLGVVPLAARVDADHGAAADRTHGLGFGENFSVRPDAHFQVLRPHALGQKNFFEFDRFGGARHHTAQVVANDRHHGLAHGFGAAGVATGLLFDHPLQHAGHKRHACCFDRLQVAGRHEPGLVKLALGFIAVGQGLGGAGQAFGLA